MRTRDAYKTERELVALIWTLLGRTRGLLFESAKVCRFINELGFFPQTTLNKSALMSVVETVLTWIDLFPRLTSELISRPFCWSTSNDEFRPYVWFWTIVAPSPAEVIKPKSITCFKDLHDVEKLPFLLVKFNPEFKPYPRMFISLFVPKLSDPSGFLSMSMEPNGSGIRNWSETTLCLMRFQAYQFERRCNKQRRSK